MKNRFYVYALGAMLMAGTSYAEEPLTLEAAIRQALAHSPELSLSEAYKARARGLMQSAEVRPNPELNIEVENVAGSSPQNGTNAAEFTYGLNQRIELGGKRGKRIASAASASSIQQLQADLVAKTIKHDVTLAYMEVIAAQRKLALAEEQINTMQGIRKVVARRVEAGREPDVQMTKTGVTIQMAEAAYSKAKIDLQSSRSRLVALLGGEALPEALDVAAFDTLQTLPAFSLEKLEQLPTIRLAQLNQKRTADEVNLAKAQAIPDPSLGVGFRQFKETDSNAFLFSVSVPLPVFDSNRGGISAAQADAIEAEVNAKKAAVETRIEVEALMNLARSNRERIDSIRKDVLPTVAEANTSLLAGYDKGRFTLLDVLDGRRAIQDAQLQLIDAQLSYHQVQARLEKIIPAPAEEIQPNQDIPGEQ